MPADRPAQLYCVADLRYVMEEGRDLAVVEPLDCQLDVLCLLRRRGDGVAALCPVAVERREPHIHMLPARKEKGAACASRKLFTRGVSAWIAVMAAS
jgi:hypothetical protein